MSRSAARRSARDSSSSSEEMSERASLSGDERKRVISSC